MNRTILTIILALAATMAQAVTKLGSTTTNTIVAESSDIDVLSNQNAAAFSGILNLSNSIPVVPSTFTDTTARASAATAQGGVASLSNTVADLPTFQSITNALYGTQIYSMTTDVVVTSTGGDDYNGPPLGTIFTDPEYSAMWTYATTNSYYVLADPLDPTNLYACDTWIVTKGVGQPTWAAMGTLPLTITNVSAGATGTLTITFRQLLIGTTNAFQAAESDTNALTQLWGETNRATQADAGFQATLDRYDSETNEIWQGTYGWIGVSGTVVRTVTDWNAASGTVYAGAALGASSLQPNAVDGTDPLGNVFANGQLTTLGAGTPWTLMGYLTAETDPVAGAITGLIKGNGAGTLSAAGAGTDYVASETDPVAGAVTGIIKGNGAGILSAADGTDISALEDDPSFDSWLAGVPNISTFNNDSAFIDAAGVPAAETDGLSWHKTDTAIVYGTGTAGAGSLSVYGAVVDTLSLGIGDTATAGGASVIVASGTSIVGNGSLGVGGTLAGGDGVALVGSSLTALNYSAVFGLSGVVATNSFFQGQYGTLGNYSFAQGVFITGGDHEFIWNPDEINYAAESRYTGHGDFTVSLNARNGLFLDGDGQFNGGAVGLTNFPGVIYYKDGDGNQTNLPLATVQTQINTIVGPWYIPPTATNEFTPAGALWNSNGVPMIHVP